MLSFLKIIRPVNLLFIAITELLIRYSFYHTVNASYILSDFGYILGVIATLCIAGAGNIINDIYDVEADRINKPGKILIGRKLSEKKATYLFITLNIIGVGIGFYLANSIGRPGFSAILIVISALLYIYSSYLKHIAIIGNIVISLLVALVVILPPVFDLLPAITPQNRETQSLVFSILLDYAVFAFLINLLREIIKDEQDINGDHHAGIQTLPILIGIRRTNTVVFALGVFVSALTLYFTYTYLFRNTAAVLYVLALIMGPLLYFLTNILGAKKKKEFGRLSLILKLILFFGLISLGLHQYLIA